MNKSLITLQLFLVMAGAVYASAIQAEMYKWVDAEGNVQYTQTPPPEGVEGETVKPPPRVNTEQAVKDFDKSQADAVKARETQQKQEQETAKTAEEEAAHQEKCERTRQQLQDLQRPRITTTDKDGNRVRMNEEQRIQAIKDVEKVLSENCK